MRNIITQLRTMLLAAAAVGTFAGTAAAAPLATENQVRAWSKTYGWSATNSGAAMRRAGTSIATTMTATIPEEEPTAIMAHDLTPIMMTRDRASDLASVSGIAGANQSS
jgi:hypothetical protein